MRAVVESTLRPCWPGARRILWILTALASFSSPPARGQVGWGTEGVSLGPILVGEGTDVVGGVRVELNLAQRTVRADPCYPRTSRAALAADIPLTWEAERNSESIRAQVGGGLRVALICRPGAEAGQPPPIGEPQRWGFVEVTAQGRMETLQRLEEADVSLGASVTYAHDQDRLWFLPGVSLSYALVDCVGCDLEWDEEPWAQRVELEARWSVPLAAVMPEPLDPLRLRAQGRLFTAMGMGEAVKALREEEGLWGGVELAYTVSGVEWLHEVHAGWWGGRLPVRLTSEEAWEVGATVVF